MKSPFAGLGLRTSRGDAFTVWMESAVYNEKRIKKSELLQLLLLDSLYAQSGSEEVIFQGGTALRWVYGGMRYSEDLDFVTTLPRKKLQIILDGAFQSAQRACIAQFGPGKWEYHHKGQRKEAVKVFFIYRPERYRERIAVKLEFEKLRGDHPPEFQKFILRDLPLVAGMVATGRLFLPYSSSIILAETLDEIFSDKIRALYERRYIKGRDVYDIWWMKTRLKIMPRWSTVKKKLFMYQAAFVPARGTDYFTGRTATSDIRAALDRDLSRFLPEDNIAVYREKGFTEFIAALNEVNSALVEKGIANVFESLTD